MASRGKKVAINRQDAHARMIDCRALTLGSEQGIFSIYRNPLSQRTVLR